MNPDEAPTVPPSRPPAGPDEEPSDARYVLGEKLGEGAMGGVWAARDLALDRDVAFKVLHDAFLGAEHQERLAKEARAMARLNHPNVVAVYDVGQRGGRMYLTMELVRGSSLSAWLQTPRTLPQILEVFREAAAGLAAAHAAGIVHRDVKPTNILVGDDGRARVADFGVAHAATVRPGAGERVTTETAGMIGTPAYMAPEQLAGEPSDGRADQFALCVSLFEALRGVRPFEATTVGGLIMAIARGAPPPTRNLPAWIQEVIARGLAASPEARFPSMTALRDALAGPRARRGLYAALGLGVVAAAGTVAFVATRGGGTTDEPIAGVPDAAQVAAAPADAAPAADAAVAPPPIGGRALALRHISDGVRIYDDKKDYFAALEHFKQAIPLEEGSTVGAMWAARTSCDLLDEKDARAYLAKIPKDTPEGKTGRQWVITHCAKNLDLSDAVAGAALPKAPPTPPRTGSAGSAQVTSAVPALPTDRKERLARYKESMNAARAAQKAGDFATARAHALDAVPYRDINALEPLVLAVITSCLLKDVPTARELFPRIPLLIINARQHRADAAGFCERQGISLVDLMDPSERKHVVP